VKFGLITELPRTCRNFFSKTTTMTRISVQRKRPKVQCQKPGAKFSKLLRKIFGRLLFQRQYADFRNFFGKCLWKNLRRSSKEDFEKRCAIFKTSLETP